MKQPKPNSEPQQSRKLSKIVSAALSRPRRHAKRRRRAARELRRWKPRNAPGIGIIRPRQSVKSPRIGTSRWGAVMSTSERGEISSSSGSVARFVDGWDVRYRPIRDIDA